MNKILMYLDDLRTPSSEWTLIKTVREAKEFMLNNDVYTMSLDHDLGGSCNSNCYKEEENDLNHTMLRTCEKKCKCDCHETGYDFVKWMADNDCWPANRPLVHSANPVGATNMRSIIDQCFPGVR